MFIYIYIYRKRERERERDDYYNVILDHMILYTTKLIFDIYIYIYTSETARAWVFRDVLFQDVWFQNTISPPLTHISFRCEVPTPSVDEGQPTIIFKPHVLKHRVPELPNRARCGTTLPEAPA